MASTYDKIATASGTGSSGSITFSSIAGIYTDLVVVCAARLTTGAGDLLFEFNGDTGSNYSTTYLTGTGSAASSGRFSNQIKTYNDVNGYVDTTNAHNSITHIMNYSNSTTYKTLMSRSNNAAGGTDATVSLWRSTAAIIQVRIYLSNNFATSSTFTLYGIKAA